MKAAQVAEYGGPEVVTTVSDAPKPEITPDQVLVEVHAAGVNPFDWKVRQGLVRSMAELTFPAVLGGDVAGVIAAVGANVSHVKVGDEVYGLAGALSSHGSFAEFAPVAAASVAHKPSTTDFTVSAALPLVGVSAYQGIVDVLHVQPGQKVLITGGAGGIGAVAVQIAKHLGAYVAVTAGARHADYLKSLGADEIIDYQTKAFEDELSDYDAVFDTVGGDTFTKAFEVVKSGGALATMAAGVDDALAKAKQVTATGIYTQATTERLTKLAELVDSGIVSVKIDKTFPLDDAAAALDYVQHESQQGKVVITVKN